MYPSSSPYLHNLLAQALYAHLFGCGQFQNLNEGQGALTTILNESGGIIDDCIVTNAGDAMLVCTHVLVLNPTAHIQALLS